MAKVLNVEIRNPLSSPEFEKRLDAFRFNTNYIVRFRSILDKLMALLVILGEPEEYDSFSKANKRLKKFGEIAEESQRIPSALSIEISNLARYINEKFRTAEVHGTGTVRKWIFEAIAEPESPQIDIFWAWNSLVSVLEGLQLAFATRTIGKPKPIRCQMR